PSGLHGFLFEVQVKTFLQHAWGIATHDLVYKANEVSWATSRVAFQVKAMLENAELSISEAKRLTDCNILDRTDEHSQNIIATIEAIRARWTDAAQLPQKMLRLAQNIHDLSRTLRIGLPDLWRVVD